MLLVEHVGHAGATPVRAHDKSSVERVDTGAPLRTIAFGVLAAQAALVRCRCICVQQGLEAVEGSTMAFISRFQRPMIPVLTLEALKAIEAHHAARLRGVPHALVTGLGPYPATPPASLGVWHAAQV